MSRGQMVGRVSENRLQVKNFLFEPVDKARLKVWFTSTPPPTSPLHFYIAPRLIAMSCGVMEDIRVSDNMLTVITTHN